MGVKVGTSEVGVYLGSEKLAGVGGGNLLKTETPFNHTIKSTFASIPEAQTFTVDIEDTSATLDSVALNDVSLSWSGTNTGVDQMQVSCAITGVENGLVTISANWAWSISKENVTVTGKILNFKVG